MDAHLRASQPADLPFLWEMVYEGVFWRARPNRPSFEEGLAYPEVRKALADWGERDGDTAVIATVHSVPAGAAWYRFWTDDNPVTGYVDETTPVLAIAVRRGYRNQGIGKRMIEWLIAHASEHSVPQISLSVSKDNLSLHLYRREGFQELADRGDALTMVRRIRRL
jgi:ribosomal protein S18 acetylase RimI-like enzyme